MNGEYQIEMPDDALLRDLMHVALHGGNGNDWPIPYTGANSHWNIESNIGILAYIYTDKEGDIEFMHRLVKDAAKKVFFIVDNLKVHHGKKVQKWLEKNKDSIEVFYIPSYSPDLNPDEYF